MKKKNRPTDGGGNWMDTYGDLVTLLLTFFVMLYSMSNLSEQKWEVFVRSIFPKTPEVVEDVSINMPVSENDSELTGSTKINGEIPDPMDIDTLYLTLAQKMNEIGIDGVTITRGEDYTFIVFKDKTFFDGDSSVLTDQGKMTLDVFCDVIDPVSDGLSQINIMGHTSQGDPEKPNEIRTDRMLSALRGAEVCISIQTRNVIEPEKLMTTSYGQFRPVESPATTEGRAKNRRVELLLIDEGADVRSLNEYYDEYNSGVNADTTIVTEGPGFSPAEPNAESVSTNMSPVSEHVQETSSGTGGTDDPAPAANPSASTDGAAPTANPTSGTDGAAPTANPTSGTDGAAPMANPSSGTDGAAPAANPSSGTDGIAPTAESPPAAVPDGTEAGGMSE